MPTYLLLCTLVLKCSFRDLISTKYLLQDNQQARCQHLNSRSRHNNTQPVTHYYIFISAIVGSLSNQQVALFSVGSIRQTGELTRSVSSSVAHIPSHRSPPLGAGAWLRSRASCQRGSGPGLWSCALSSMSWRCSSSYRSCGFPFVWTFPWWMLQDRMKTNPVTTQHGDRNTDKVVYMINIR